MLLGLDSKEDCKIYRLELPKSRICEVTVWVCRDRVDVVVEVRKRIPEIVKYIVKEAGFEVEEVDKVSDTVYKIYATSSRRGNLRELLTRLARGLLEL